MKECFTTHTVRAWRCFAASMSLLLLVGCRLDPDQVLSELYESWRKENREADNLLTQLATGLDWKLYVATSSGIGRLRIADRTFEPLYNAAPGRAIWFATKVYAGRLAFTECIEKSDSRQRRLRLSDFHLVILDRDGKATKVRLSPVFEDEWPTGIALGSGQVFLVSQFGRAAHIYDMQTKALRTVFESQPPYVPRDTVEKADIVEGSFLVLLMRDGMLVLDADPPYGRVSWGEGISGVAVVGDKIVIEKDGVCFLYDPHIGVTERLTEGNLVGGLGVDEFLCCVLDQGRISGGRGKLFRYRLSSRSKRLLWEPSGDDAGFGLRAGEKKFYNYTKLSFSPQGRCLLLPWYVPPRTHEELHLGQLLEYEVYDLRTGEKRGAFLNVYKGKFFFRFLGWADGENVEAPEGDELE